jgi:predicted P-loop ATPase
LIFLQEALNVPVKHVGAVNTAVNHASRKALIHPVQDYLYTQKWDGTPRLNTALRRLFKAEGDEVYQANVFPAFMISAVARVMDPGCKADQVLVLEGKQGCGKSRAVRALCPNEAWFSESLPPLTNKDAEGHLQGIWINELPELAALKKQGDEKTKAFLSRCTDRFRLPFGTYPHNAPRRCVFIATTNETKYLTDISGNRRFWPARVGDIDVAAITVERPQLWAEAFHRYKSGERWHLTRSLEVLALGEVDLRRNFSELERLVTDYLEQLIAKGCKSVTTEEIFGDVLQLQRKTEAYVRLTSLHSLEVIRTLNRLGWTESKITGRGHTRKNTYYPPS